MRIESYGPQAFGRIPAMNPANSAAPTTPSTEPESLTAQEKLGRLLDEKRSLAQSAFDGTVEGTLGKHIDLRV